MSFHALVVDDSPDILEDVKDRLESLGHTCDCATCQRDARDHLAQNEYSYVLLDLEIPTRYGKPSRIPNGQSLLREIREMEGHELTPIIVMTSHGHDSPDLAVEVFRGNGATDYLKKPFPDLGHTLEKVVQDALAACGRSHPGAATKSTAVRQLPPQPFEHGEMVFREDRVELCGVKICGSPESGLIRLILDELRRMNTHGRFEAYSGEGLAKRIDCSTGQNGVAGAVREFRKKVVELLSNEANIQCGPRDIIQSGGRGYRLTEKITVRDADDPVTDRNDPANDPVNGQRDPVNDPVSVADDPENNDRQRWALEQMVGGRPVRLGDLEDEFGCSKTTAKRDLASLRKRGLITFEGPPKTGHWRLVG